MSTFYGISDKTSCRVAKRSLYLAWKLTDASEKCVVGFAYENAVYFRTCEHAFLSPFIGVTRDEGGKETQDFKIRLVFGEKQKPLEIASGKWCKLCEWDEFENYRLSKGLKNYGDTFELFMKKTLGLPETKDNTAFWEGSDLVFNNVSYSVKFEGGTIATEKHFYKGMGFTADDMPCE